MKFLLIIYFFLIIFYKFPIDKVLPYIDLFTTCVDLFVVLMEVPCKMNIIFVLAGFYDVLLTKSMESWKWS